MEVEKQFVLWTGLGIYLAITLAIGLIASKRVRESADFIVAGRRLSLFLCTGTLAATWFGGGLCIGAASAAYGGGFLAVIADPFGAALCLFLAGLFYVRLLRRMRLMTIASFFTSRFDSRAGLVAGLCTIPAYVGWVASLMVAFGRILQSLTGIDAMTAICIGAAVVILYTIAGGMWAVTLTDAVQVVVLIVGMAIIAPIMLADAGGWTSIASRIPAERFDLIPSGGTEAWFGYARDWLVIGLGNLAGQDLIQRSLSGRDEKVAYKSAYLAGLLYVTIGFLPVLLGMAGAVVLPQLADPDMVMMELALKYLPVALLILFTGALMSAILSSADSALLAPASVLGWDICRHLFPKLSEGAALRVSRLAVFVLGAVALMLALRQSAVYESAALGSAVYDLMVDSWSVLLATLFVPLTAGLWWSKTNAPGAFAAIIAGLIAWLSFLSLAPELPADLMAVPIAAIALVGVSLATARRTPHRPLADANGDAISTANRLGL